MPEERGAYPHLRLRRAVLRLDYLLAGAERLHLRGKALLCAGQLLLLQFKLGYLLVQPFKLDERRLLALERHSGQVFPARRHRLARLVLHVHDAGLHLLRLEPGACAWW